MITLSCDAFTRWKVERENWTPPPSYWCRRLTRMEIRKYETLRLYVYSVSVGYYYTIFFFVIIEKRRVWLLRTYHFCRVETKYNISLCTICTISTCQSAGFVWLTVNVWKRPRNAYSIWFCRVLDRVTQYADNFTGCFCIFTEFNTTQFIVA